MTLSWNDPSRAARALPWLGMLLAAAAISLHSPGHVSMDTSVQLYEASLGKSVSWNPPFMSALMRWLGGGELATASLVFFSSVLIYLGLSAAAADSLQAGAGDRGRASGWLRLLLCGLVLLNPVIFLYVGIVWKDVLFASVTTAAASLALVAANAAPGRSFFLASVSVLLLAVSMQVRQQGVFMAPVLLLMPIIAFAGYRGWPPGRKRAAALALAAIFVATLFATKAMVGATIVGAGDKSSSVGFRSIMSFDIAGTVARSDTPTASLPVAITGQQRAAVRRVYSSLRVDYLLADPEASEWLRAMGDEKRKAAWLALARQETGAFLEHKWVTFRTVLGLNGVESCLPIYIGVDGNSDYLRAAGVAAGRDGRDRAVYDMASYFDDWLIYRHWVYVSVLLAGMVALAVVRLPAKTRLMAGVLALATGLFYLSFLPTAIACDFRYLFTGIPLVSLLAMVLVARGGHAEEMR
jgi:hypothetical protein